MATKNPTYLNLLEEFPANSGGVTPEQVQEMITAALANYVDKKTFLTELVKKQDKITEETPLSLGVPFTVTFKGQEPAAPVKVIEATEDGKLLSNGKEISVKE